MSKGDVIVAMRNGVISQPVVWHWYRAWTVRRVRSPIYIAYKKTLMDYVLAQAKAHGWNVWKKRGLLYVESPCGQISYHLMKGDERPEIATREDFEWNGKRGESMEATLRIVSGRYDLSIPDFEMVSECPLVFRQVAALED